MKITKNPDKYDMNVYLREKVLKECYICPFCGEARTYNPFKVDKDNKLIKPYGVWDTNIYHDKSANCDAQPLCKDHRHNLNAVHGTAIAYCQTAYRTII